MKTNQMLRHNSFIEVSLCFNNIEHHNTSTSHILIVRFQVDEIRSVIKTVSYFCLGDFNCFICMLGSFFAASMKSLFNVVANVLRK